MLHVSARFGIAVVKTGGQPAKTTPAQMQEIPAEQSKAPVAQLDRASAF
jgi:hypothetical protein